MSININYNVSPIPSADGNANVSWIDVVGNKEDAASVTADTASIVALCRAIIDLIGDSGADVLGNLNTLAHTGAADDATTIIGYTKQLITDLRSALADIGDASGSTLTSLYAILGNPASSLSTQIAAIKAVVDLGAVNSTVAKEATLETGIGTTFWLKKTVTSSDILEVSSVDITGVSSVGELMIEDVIVKTDVTGLATGTNFELLCTNDKGNPYIFRETVLNLGSYQTVELIDASVTGIKTILEVGKKLQVHSTVAACTGVGTIDIYIKLRRLTAGATIATL